MVSCLACKVWVGKKHVFGSSVGCRGGGCQTLACALAVPVCAMNLLLMRYG